ncbi:MAG: hypothetical protein QM702_19630 [Rubrivivax sp.]
MNVLLAVPALVGCGRAGPVGVRRGLQRGDRALFLDIGAHDGVSISNTYVLALRWNGLCIEANPKTFQALIRNRRAACINVCLDRTEGEVDFAVRDVLGGIVSPELDNAGPQAEVLRVRPGAADVLAGCHLSTSRVPRNASWTASTSTAFNDDDRRLSLFRLVILKEMDCFLHSDFLPSTSETCSRSIQEAPVLPLGLSACAAARRALAREAARPAPRLPLRHRRPGERGRQPDQPHAGRRLPACGDGDDRGRAGLLPRASGATTSSSSRCTSRPATA